MSGILLSLALSLTVTLAVELLLAVLLKIRSIKDLSIIALVNVLTNPVVNYCYYWAIYFFSKNSIYTWLIIIVLELAAVFTELLIYRPLLSFERFGKLKLSFLLNGASFLMGLLISGVMRLFS